MRYLFAPFCTMLFAALPVAAEEGVAKAPIPNPPAAVSQLEPTVGAGDVFQVFVALLFVIALIVVTAWLFRRYSGATFSRNGALRTLAGISVGQRERIVLIQAGETQMLLGVAPGSVRKLHVFDKPVLVDTQDGKGAERFAERLQSALKTKQEGQS